MRMSDNREIQANPASVFAALLDPEVLKACVSGAQEVSGNPQDGYAATVVQKIGPVKATFKGQVTMSEMVENQRLVIVGEGKGGVAGFAKGVADVTLEPAGNGGTILTYEVEAKVGGKLAQLGSRLIDSFARNMADQFFARLQQVLEGPVEEVAADTGDTSAQDAPKKKGWLNRMTSRDKSSKASPEN